MSSDLALTSHWQRNRYCICSRRNRDAIQHGQGEEQHFANVNNSLQACFWGLGSGVVLRDSECVQAMGAGASPVS